MLTDDILQQINDLQGMDEFKAFCRRLVTAATNMETQRLGRVPLPSLIFAATPGCGVTLHIRLLTNLLKALRLMPFIGEEDAFEWELTNDEKDFDLFLRRVKQAGGFYGQFRGVVGLEIGNMLHDPLPPMDRLMEYMDARQGKILFILIVPDDTQKSVLLQLLGRFSSISPVELIHMPFPKEEAKEYVAQQLISRGFTLSEAAKAALRDAVQLLSDTEGFEGYQTLQNLADVLIWQRISQQEMQSKEIDAADIASVMDRNGYNSYLNAYARRVHRHRLGFGANTED